MERLPHWDLASIYPGVKSAELSRAFADLAGLLDRLERHHGSVLVPLGGKTSGKTGTAETGRGNIYTAWFAAFAPAEAPRVAIAVVVENQLNGFGGAISAPIAKQVMEALLR